MDGSRTRLEPGTLDKYTAWVKKNKGSENFKPMHEQIKQELARKYPHMDMGAFEAFGSNLIDPSRDIIPPGSMDTKRLDSDANVFADRWQQRVYDNIANAGDRESAMSAMTRDVESAQRAGYPINEPDRFYDMIDHRYPDQSWMGTARNLAPTLGPVAGGVLGGAVGGPIGSVAGAGIADLAAQTLAPNEWRRANPTSSVLQNMAADALLTFGPSSAGKAARQLGSQISLPQQAAGMVGDALPPGNMGAVFEAVTRPVAGAVAGGVGVPMFRGEGGPSVAGAAIGTLSAMFGTIGEAINEFPKSKVKVAQMADEFDAQGHKNLGKFMRGLPGILLEGDDSGRIQYLQSMSHDAGINRELGLLSKQLGVSGAELVEVMLGVPAGSLKTTGGKRTARGVEEAINEYASRYMGGFQLPANLPRSGIDALDKDLARVDTLIGGRNYKAAKILKKKIVPKLQQTTDRMSNEFGRVADALRNDTTSLEPEAVQEIVGRLKGLINRTSGFATVPGDNRMARGMAGAIDQKTAEMFAQIKTIDELLPIISSGEFSQEMAQAAMSHLDMLSQQGVFTVSDAARAISEHSKWFGNNRAKNHMAGEIREILFDALDNSPAAGRAQDFRVVRDKWRQFAGLRKELEGTLRMSPGALGKQIGSALPPESSMRTALRTLSPEVDMAYQRLNNHLVGAPLGEKQLYKGFANADELLTAAFTSGNPGKSKRAFTLLQRAIPDTDVQNRLVSTKLHELSELAMSSMELAPGQHHRYFNAAEFLKDLKSRPVLRNHPMAQPFVSNAEDLTKMLTSPDTQRRLKVIKAISEGIADDKGLDTIMANIGGTLKSDQAREILEVIQIRHPDFANDFKSALVGSWLYPGGPSEPPDLKAFANKLMKLDGDLGRQIFGDNIAEMRKGAALLNQAATKSDELVSRGITPWVSAVRTASSMSKYGSVMLVVPIMKALQNASGETPGEGPLNMVVGGGLTAAVAGTAFFMPRAWGQAIIRGRHGGVVQSMNILGQMLNKTAEKIRQRAVGAETRRERRER